MKIDILLVFKSLTHFRVLRSKHYSVLHEVAVCDSLGQCCLCRLPLKINISLLFCIIYVVNFDNGQFVVTDVRCRGTHRSRFNWGHNYTVSHMMWQVGL